MALLPWVVTACAEPTEPGAGATTEAGGDGATTMAEPEPTVDGPIADEPTADGPSADGTSAESESTTPSSGRVLMVVAFNNTWWAEYKVMIEALAAAGYEVEVRSSTDDAVALSYGNRVDETPAGLPGVDPIAYEEFRAQFEASFGVAWDSAWNEPGPIPLDGRVQDARMEDYVALVFPGGSGSQFWRYDGQYEDLPGPAWDPEHVSPAADIAAAAAAIDDLVVDALVQGSPVLAVCHAGPTPGFARVPGTEGQGPDGLGLSLLQGRSATGFPLEIEVFGAVGDVAAQYGALGIQFLSEQAVVVDGPAVDLDGDGSPDGAGLVVTARSWYPEEVVQGTSALLDLLDG